MTINIEKIKELKAKLHLKHTTGELDTLCDDEVMVIAEFEHSVRIAPGCHLNLPLAKNVTTVGEIAQLAIDQAEENKELQRWKDEACRANESLDIQGIGSHIGLEVGETIRDKILPFMEKQAEEIKRLNDIIDEMVGET